MLITSRREIKSGLDHGGIGRGGGVKSLVSGYILMVKSAGFDALLMELARKRITKDDTEMFSLGNRKAWSCR